MGDACRTCITKQNMVVTKELVAEHPELAMYKENSISVMADT